MSGAGILGASDLPPELAARARRGILSLADSKRLLGIRYSDWLLGAPSIEAGIATASMCQDEWGHARLLYAMLKEFGVSPRKVEHRRPAEEYASIDPLDHPFPDWAALIAGVIVVDGAISAVLEGFSAGRYDQAQTRVPKMLAEEEYHADLGGAWFRKLASGSDEARERLIQACEAYLPRTLAWVAPEDDAHGELVEAGIFGSAAASRSRFERAVDPFLRLIDLDVGGTAAERSSWDAVRGRGPGHPDEESVERARGDLNRSLLVG